MNKKLRPPEPEQGPRESREKEEIPEEDPRQEESGDMDGSDKSAESGMSFHQAWEAVLAGGLHFSQVGTVMIDLLKKQGTALGKFQQKLAKHAVAPSEPGARREILPISLEAVKEFLAVPEGRDTRLGHLYLHGTQLSILLGLFQPEVYDSSYNAERKTAAPAEESSPARSGEIPGRKSGSPALIKS